MRKPATKPKPAPPKPSAAVTAGPHIPAWLLAILLGLVTMALYWPATRHDFVSYDDDLYVTANSHVQAGLTLESVKWAFFQPDAKFGYWHPLTLLSHMADCQMYGLKPWGHHLTSVLLHAINTMLVFLLLRRLTGAMWRSAVVAALFGWHPVHVESVAWVAERKDVLSALFGLLSLLFYARYAQKRTSHIPQPVTLDYALTLFFFALGLMSKPMLVTWPFVMLLLDYWPLARFKPGRVWRLVWEKVPFLALVVVVNIVTLVISKQLGTLSTVQSLSIGSRVGNALISYCRYLGKLFWPTKLAVFYPRPGHWPPAEELLAGGLLLGISLLFIANRRRHLFLLTGWLWFVGMLVPVIGLVQVGDFAMADRYTYLPSLGVLIVVVWGIYELTGGWRHRVIALSMAGSAAVILCLAMTRQQLGYWQDDETLFRHALAVTENNYVAHNIYGNAILHRGQTDEAISQFQEAIRLEPSYSLAHNNLGMALGMKGQIDEAIGQVQEALRLEPNLAEAHNNLGNALYIKGRIDEAISQFQEAIRLNPDFATARDNLARVLEAKNASTDTPVKSGPANLPR